MQIRRLAVGEVEIEIAEAGVGQRPLLLLHGFTGAKEDFTDWLDLLAEAGWHAVAPDQRGHGESSKPGSESEYSFAIYAADALGLAECLGWERFAILGHSMGGFVAQNLAFSAPQRLSALVLMDTGHGPIRIARRELVEAAISIVRERGIDALAEILAERDSPLDTPAHESLIANRPGYAEFESRKLRSSSPVMYAAMADELLSAPDTLERLRELPETLRALVIVGEQDTPFVSASDRIAEALPDARVALIPDAGHSPQFENPAAWWEALSEFLAGLTD
jgi:3-oxoadipate enol-lactonase